MVLSHSAVGGYFGPSTTLFAVSLSRGGRGKLLPTMEMASGAAERQPRLATKVQSGVNADKVVGVASVGTILEIRAVRRLVLHAQEASADTGIISSDARVQLMRVFLAVALVRTTEVQLLPTQRTTWQFPTASRPFLHVVETDFCPAKAKS